ncbi:MAG TPA: phospholipase D-like domain-containing protein [Steroidobacteraceae bacterium]|nr:phospholipase D-like domain-containing protein [Steroidobacteraceae bacterium]
MPFVIDNAAHRAAIEALASGTREEGLDVTLEMVPRNCHLAPPYHKVSVPGFTVNGELVAYASPDSTFAVTKRLIDAAKKTIAIGMYDFTATYVATLLKDAMARGVKVTLMLDTDHVAGEDAIFKNLADLGARCVPAPSCASPQKVCVFRSAHEKFIVIDGETCLIQSGNFSNNSLPMNVGDGVADGHFRTGNRDMGVAVQSKALAKFLTGILDSDMKLETDGKAGATPEEAAEPPPVLVEAAPGKRPTRLFPSKTFALTSPLPVQLILSPDNYMQILPAVLAKAKKSVLIQQQYIHSADASIAQLLRSIADARKKAPKLDVRIFLGKIFDDKALQKEKVNLQNLADTYGLKLGVNIRYVDTTRLVHCHNKLVLIDGTTVLVSSQNWSNAAVNDNREAGLLFDHKGVASYFTQIFETDWAVAQKKLPTHIASGGVSTEALAGGGYIEVTPADYQEV